MRYELCGSGVAFGRLAEVHAWADANWPSGVAVCVSVTDCPFGPVGPFLYRPTSRPAVMECERGGEYVRRPVRNEQGCSYVILGDGPGMPTCTRTPHPDRPKGPRQR